MQCHALLCGRVFFQFILIMSDITLIHAPYDPIYFIPPGMNYLLNYLKKNGFNSDMIDMNVDLFNQYNEIWLETEKFKKNFTPGSDFEVFINKYIDTIINYIKGNVPRYFGFTLYYTSYDFTVYFVKKLKESFPNTKMIAGGPDVFINLEKYKKLLKENVFDVLILKEGEKRLVSLLRDAPYSSGSILTIDNIDSEYTLDKQELLDIETESVELEEISFFPDLPRNFKIIPIFASRGCPGMCTFCMQKSLWDTLRTKKPRQVVNEMINYYNRWGIDVFHFTDLTLNSSERWFSEFIEILENETYKFAITSNFRLEAQLNNSGFLKRMLNAGIRYMDFGVESGSQIMLDRIKKGTNNNQNCRIIKNASGIGLFINTSFIVGLPDETSVEFLETIRCVKDILWSADCITINFFENLQHSPGYVAAAKYLEKHSEEKEYQIKKRIFNNEICEFNKLGAYPMPVYYAYNLNADVYKRAITKYYELKYMGVAQNELRKKFVNNELIYTDNEFWEILIKIYDIKRQQENLLIQIINNC